MLYDSIALNVAIDGSQIRALVIEPGHHRELLPCSIALSEAIVMAGRSVLADVRNATNEGSTCSGNIHQLASSSKAIRVESSLQASSSSTVAQLIEA